MIFIYFIQDLHLLRLNKYYYYLKHKFQCPLLVIYAYQSKIQIQDELIHAFQDKNESHDQLKTAVLNKNALILTQ